MPNMSYCRFRNTLPDLRDCLNNMWNVSSETEAKCRKSLVAVAIAIVEESENNKEDIDNCVFDEECCEDDSD